MNRVSRSPETIENSSTSNSEGPIRWGRLAVLFSLCAAVATPIAMMNSSSTSKPHDVGSLDGGEKSRDATFGRKPVPTRGRIEELVRPDGGVLLASAEASRARQGIINALNAISIDELDMLAYEIGVDEIDGFGLLLNTITQLKEALSRNDTDAVNALLKKAYDLIEALETKGREYTAIRESYLDPKYGGSQEQIQKFEDTMAELSNYIEWLKNC